MTTIGNTSPTAASGAPQPPPRFFATQPGLDFDEASAAVVDYLKAFLPMGFWAVTRFDGLRQLYLEVRDDSYGVGPGGFHLWEDSFCINMVAGTTPRVAPDAMAIPEFATAEVAHQLDIGSYVGVPITHSDGELFGTLCGLDPAPRSDELLQHRPLLEILGMLLSTIVDADLERTRQARKLEQVEMTAESDGLTGLLNRRGWDRYMEIEEARFKRFGDPGGVMTIGLDGLREINDTHGHQAGDDTIKLAASVIRIAIRDTDIAARLGGDEFGIIATNVLPADRQQLAYRLRVAFDDAGVPASIGHAPYTVSAGFPGAVAAADEAMYAEKQRRQAAHSATGCP
jgi:diguanylate cyclase